MPNYQEGKIYKIVSDDTEFIYIGSTTRKYLSQRLAKHKSQYDLWKKTNKNYVSSYELLEHNSVRIILLELYPCQIKDELRAKEQWWIDECKDSCVNKYKAYTGIKATSKKEYNTLYWLKNEEKLRVKNKQYQLENKEKITENRQKNIEHILLKQKQHYQENKEKITDYHKQYRQENLEKIKNYKNEKFICECGSSFTRANKEPHKKTKRHQAFINQV